jgi:K+/H+ antiporter YhaU regulatory subunit KhtT
MEQALEHEAQLQRALDQSMTAIALRDKELKDIRQILNETAETEKGGRQSIEAFGRQVTELQTSIAAYAEKLTRTISTDGRHEMRAFEALLARRSWRGRLVLWLLGTTNKR